MNWDPVFLLESLTALVSGLIQLIVQIISLFFLKQ